MNFNDPYGNYQYNARNVNQAVGGSFMWVNSRKEAEEISLNPNGAQMMMNRNEKEFYLKSCDGFGMVQSFKAFRYSEITDIPENTKEENGKSIEYVSREEFVELKAEIEALKSAKKPKVKEDNVT